MVKMWATLWVLSMVTIMFRNSLHVERYYRMKLRDLLAYLFRTACHHYNHDHDHHHNNHDHHHYLVWNRDPWPVANVDG